MHIISKQGSADNVLTYEHICDTAADMATIERKYITLGSVCIVLQGSGGAMEVYMADSNKEWHDIMINSGNNGSTEGSGLTIHICTTEEVSNGLPNIEYPLETVLYLVPASENSGNLYEEYIYVNNAWEKFGSGNINANTVIYGGNVESADYLVNEGIMVPEREKAGAIKLYGTFVDLYDSNNNIISYIYEVERNDNMEIDIYTFSDLDNGIYTLNTENMNVSFYLYDTNGHELAAGVQSYNIEINNNSVVYIVSIFDANNMTE